MTDRLDWIFGGAGESLASRYDEWALTYDQSHDGWGWQGPALAAAALVGELHDDFVVMDAGCGTAAATKALRSQGFAGRVVGLDFSAGMLSHAKQSQACQLLVRASLLDIPMADGCVDAVISSGVFTHGHVGAEAFSELVRVCRREASVVVTMRVDIMDQLLPEAQRLEAEGKWTLVACSDPIRLHPERDDSVQSILRWVVS